MTKTRRAGFSKNAAGGGRKTVKRKRRSRVTKGAGTLQLAGDWRNFANNATNLITYPFHKKVITFFGGRRRSRGTKRRG
jgi:hypothetical protein